MALDVYMVTDHDIMTIYTLCIHRWSLRPPVYRPQMEHNIERGTAIELYGVRTASCPVKLASFKIGSSKKQSR